MKRAITALTVFLIGCQSVGDPLSPIFFSDEPHKKDQHDLNINWQESQPEPKKISLHNPSVIDRDYTQEFYAWSAHSGYAEGQQVYGLILIYDKNELAEGLDWLHKALAQRHIPAALDLAWIFMQAEKVDQNLELAMQYLTIGLEAQDKNCLRMAAQISFMQHHDSEAIQYLEQAAALGDLQSQRELAQFIIEQKRDSWREAQALMFGLENDSLMHENETLSEYWPDNPQQHHNNMPVTAEQTVQPFTDHDNSLLSKLPYTPSSYPADFYQHFESQADSNCPYACYQAALQRLNHPTAVPSQHRSSKTLEQLVDEAAQVLVPAQVLKARLILQDYFKNAHQADAYRLLKNAAQQNDPYALLAMSAWMRHLGEYDLSLDYYQQATQQQNYYAAMYRVVSDIFAGYYPFSQQKLAADWLHLLAEKSYPRALLLLADLKEKHALQGSDAEVFIHRYKAAWKGDPEAQYAIANMYLRGNFVQPNPQKAFRWFYQSAYMGYRPAQYQLAQHYAQGLGTIPNIPKAYAWRKVAGLKLYENDEYELEALVEQMNQEQLKKALDFERIFRQNFNKPVETRFSF